ncbi:hypothetical protein D3C85_1412650 [compost metagenome]
MLWHRFLRDGNVFHAGGGTRSLGKILRFTFPHYVCFACDHPVDISPQSFVIPDGYVLLEVLIIADVSEIMVFTESSIFCGVNELCQDVLLSTDCIFFPFIDALYNKSSKRFT